MLEQSRLQQLQLQQNIDEKDIQITHLKEEQDIQLRSVNSAVAASNIFSFIILHSKFKWRLIGSSEKEHVERINKRKQLLALAHKHINDHKKMLADTQVRIFFKCLLV